MGYGYYIDAQDREAGYTVAARCDHEGCIRLIDRGLAYRCEECLGFFCYTHLYMGYDQGQVCRVCADEIDKLEEESDA